ncbi:MAG: B12-binding domain-containing radical SAM protein [Candidatus Omnitrophica bacterium]|nr:B12-binding domain-containing radical SAM protein [Candidatus Omnitrophota bacterium]
MKILFVRPNKDTFGFKPIGLSLLSGIARDCGFDAQLFDTTEIDFGFVDNTSSGESAKLFRPVDLASRGLVKKKIDLRSSFKKALSDHSPDLLVFSVLSDEFLIATEISKIAKEAIPSLPIIWGGKYPTLNPEKTLKQCYADFVCLGEGLDAFREFIEALKKGDNLYKIPNIWGKKGEEIIKNAVRPLRKDLDSLPFVDWKIFDKKSFLKPLDGKIYLSGDHMLNWGCPYHCTYCINHFYHNMYKNKYFMRRYGIRRIIDELKSLKKEYNLELFKFHDEDFLMRPLENLRELSDTYRDEVNLPFVIETNSRSVTKEKVELLKNMNCVSASLAIETGDSKLRKILLNRPDSESDIIRAFSLLKDAGIRAVSFSMFGIPFESRETYSATVEINRKANVQYPDIGFFYPFEGTELREISIKEGFFDPEEKEKAVYQRNRPALHFADLSEGELIEMRNVFVLYVKLPKCYWLFIRRSENQDSLGVRLRKKLLEIYDKTIWKNDGWYKDDGLKDDYLNELEEIMAAETPAAAKKL